MYSMFIAAFCTFTDSSTTEIRSWPTFFSTVMSLYRTSYIMPECICVMTAALRTSDRRFLDRRDDASAGGRITMRRPTTKPSVHWRAYVTKGVRTTRWPSWKCAMSSCRFGES